MNPNFLELMNHQILADLSSAPECKFIEA